MMSLVDKLTIISDLSELCELRDLYLQDWPKHLSGYYCLDNFIGWLQKEPQLRNLHIFTLNGDWRSSGLCLIMDRYQLFVNSLIGSSDTKLNKALTLIDWSRGLKVSSLPERHVSAVRNVMANKQLTLEYDSTTELYYLRRDEALQFNVDCPTGFTCRDLCEADATVIDDLWPNKHCGSLFLIKRLIAWNPNAGVYENATNELVAWCLRLQGGLLGAMQVKQGFQRKGLGTLVAKAVSKKIAEMGQDVFAAVNPDNMPSKGTFEKLNFKIIDHVYWIRNYPNVAGFNWPDNE